MFDSTTKSANNITTLIAQVKTFTVKRFPINPKDDIDPDMPSTVTNSTVLYSTVITKNYTTKTVTTTTSKPQKKTTHVIKPTPQVETKETPFELKTTTRQPEETTTKHAKLQDQSGNVNAFSHEVAPFIVEMSLRHY